jgi:hypothetical protein
MFHDFIGNPSISGGLSLAQRLASVYTCQIGISNKLKRSSAVHVSLFGDELHSSLDLLACQ